MFAAAALAQQAFDVFRDTTLEQRAGLLDAIAQNIEDLGAALIARAVLETGLPQARLEGERNRTANQLRLFAKVVRDGRWLSASIDTPLPERVPRRPDLRLRKIALGPIAVFGASNFPLAFSVAGGDRSCARRRLSGYCVSAWRAPWHLGVGRACSAACRGGCGFAGRSALYATRRWTHCGHGIGGAPGD